MNYGILTILPPIIAIALAFFLKNAVLALSAAALTGCLIMAEGNPLLAFNTMLDELVTVFSGRWAVIVIICIALAFGLSKLIETSGAGRGLVQYLTVKHNIIRSKRGACFLTWSIGIALYINATLSMMLTGVIMKPINDEMRVSHEKQALLIKTSGHAACGLIPFGQWGGMLLGLIEAAGVANASAIVFKVVPVNFYCIIVIFSQLIFLLLHKDFFGIKKAEQRAEEFGYLDDPDTQEFIQNQEMKQETGNSEEKVSSPLLVMLPTLTTIVVAVTYIFISGEGNFMNGDAIGGLFRAIIVSSILCICMNVIMKVYTLTDTLDIFIKGMGQAMNILVIMVFALVLGGVISALGTGAFLAGVFHSVMSVKILPAVLFVLTCTIGFATGSCMGTASTMVPIAISWAIAAGANLPLSIAAVWSASFFGDQISPISDSTYMVCGITRCNVYNHIKTAVPYGLMWAGISLICFIVSGFVL